MLTQTPNLIVNPFYLSRITHPEIELARLPAIPRNASPVPHLTSLYHNSDAGNYGDRAYPGNCGGNLIRDLLNYFAPKSVFDPMTGSGTCRDVCRELAIACQSTDLRQGFDACDPAGFAVGSDFDFIWAHPPYWRQKVYSDSAMCLSQAKTLAEFNLRYRQFVINAADSLKQGGNLAILMGDYKDREAGFVALTYFTKQFAFEAGLDQSCTDIIRFSHGASSSKKIYRSSFIPGLHDVCMVFTKTSTRSPKEVL